MSDEKRRGSQKDLHEVSRARRERIEELVTDQSRVADSAKQLYYLCIRFREERTQIRTKKRVVQELENALDVWTTRPETEAIGSSTSTVELVIETRTAPSTIVDALEYDFIDTIDCWELAPDAFDLPVIESATDKSTDVTAEFKQLQQDFTTTDGDDTEPSGEFGDPKSVHFTEDEIGFDELITMAEADQESANGSSLADRWQQDQTLIGTLAAELDAGTADPDDVATVSEELAQTHSSTSVAVRLAHVQSRMDTFAAYIHSLEEFLDEEGTARQLLEEIRRESAAMREELQAAADHRNALQSRVTELETTAATTDELDAEMARVEQTVETTATELRRELAALDFRLDTVQTELEDHRQWRRQLSTVITNTDSQKQEE